MVGAKRPLNVLQPYSFQFQRRKACKEKCSGECPSCQLVRDRRRVLRDAMRFKSRGQFLIRYIGAFDFGLKEQARTIFPALGFRFSAHKIYLKRYISLDKGIIVSYLT